MIIMSKFNISAEDLVKFFVERGAKHTKGEGGFLINGEPIDPVEVLREAFAAPIESFELVPPRMASSFYQVNIAESQMEYPVLDEFNLVA